MSTKNGVTYKQELLQEKKSKLIRRCKTYGLSTSGSKNEMVERILKHDSKKKKVKNSSSKQRKPANDTVMDVNTPTTMTAENVTTEAADSMDMQEKTSSPSRMIHLESADKDVNSSSSSSASASDREHALTPNDPNQANVDLSSAPVHTEGVDSIIQSTNDEPKVVNTNKRNSRKANKNVNGGIAALQAKLGGGTMIMGGLRGGVAPSLKKKKERETRRTSLDNSIILSRSVVQKGHRKSRKKKKFEDLLSSDHDQAEAKDEHGDDNVNNDVHSYDQDVVAQLEQFGYSRDAIIEASSQVVDVTDINLVQQRLEAAAAVTHIDASLYHEPHNDDDDDDMKAAHVDAESADERNDIVDEEDQKLPIATQTTEVTECEPVMHGNDDNDVDEDDMHAHVTADERSDHDEEDDKLVTQTTEETEPVMNDVAHAPSDSAVARQLLNEDDEEQAANVNSDAKVGQHESNQGDDDDDDLILEINAMTAGKSVSLSPSEQLKPES